MTVSLSLISWSVQLWGSRPGLVLVAPCPGASIQLIDIKPEVVKKSARSSVPVTGMDESHARLWLGVEELSVSRKDDRPQPDPALSSIPTGSS